MTSSPTGRPAQVAQPRLYGHRASFKQAGVDVHLGPHSAVCINVQTYTHYCSRVVKNQGTPLTPHRAVGLQPTLRKRLIRRRPPLRGELQRQWRQGGRWRSRLTAAGNLQAAPRHPLLSSQSGSSCFNSVATLLHLLHQCWPSTHPHPNQPCLAHLRTKSLSFLATEPMQHSSIHPPGSCGSHPFPHPAHPAEIRPPT